MACVANGDSERIGGVGRIGRGARQQQAHHRADLVLLRVPDAGDGFLDGVRRVFGDRKAGPGRRQHADAPRLAELQRRRAVMRNEGLLDRRLVGAMRGDRRLQSVVDSDKPAGKVERVAGADGAGGDEGQLRAIDRNHAPAGALEAGVDAENANRAACHGKSVAPPTASRYMRDFAVPGVRRMFAESWSLLAGIPSLSGVLALAFAAGLVRGFAGFGAGLIFMPVASALIGPALAAVALLIADSLPTLQILFPALRQFRARQVAPVAAGYAAGAPFGVWMLAAADPVVMRWFMAALVGAFVMLIAGGFRWRAEPHPAIGLGVGATSGFFGGATQLSGPPVLAYWLGGPDSAATIRANAIVFFAVGTLLSGTGFWIAGLFTAPAIALGLAAILPYAAGIAIGARLFSGAEERDFRLVAYALIAFAGLVSLPVFDPVFGR